jgi:hypothetical protein
LFGFFGIVTNLKVHNTERAMSQLGLFGHDYKEQEQAIFDLGNVFLPFRFSALYSLFYLAKSQQFLNTCDYDMVFLEQVVMGKKSP